MIPGNGLECIEIGEERGVLSGSRIERHIVFTNGPRDLPQGRTALRLQGTQGPRLGQARQHAGIQRGAPNQILDRREETLRPRRRQLLPLRPGQTLHIARAHAHGIARRLRPRIGMPRLQRAIPLAADHIDRTHLDAVALGVLDDGRGRVETHRLGVEQGADEDVGESALHPSGGVGDQCKAGRMALGESVLPEAADLLEHLLGKGGIDALGDHALHQSRTVTLDPTAASPGGHVAAQLIGLARRVVGGHHRQADHLLLKERHAECLLEHGRQTGMGIDQGFLASATAQIGMHHAARDGTGTHQADLDHQVVIGARPQTREHRHLGAALDLEDAERVGPADHLEGRRVVGGDTRHGLVATVMAADQIEAEVELMQRTERQEVDLEQPQCFEAVLVPLDHRPVGHGSVLDRDQGRDRLVSQQESAGVDREMTGHIQDLGREPDQVPMHRLLGIQTGLAQHLARQRVARVRQQLRQTIERGLGEPQHLAHVAHCRAHPIADDVGDHRRMIPAVFGIDMLDDLLAARVLDIQIDVRRLGPLAREEALEQQPHAHRIHGGDAQAVADG